MSVSGITAEYLRAFELDGGQRAASSRTGTSTSAPTVAVLGSQVATDLFGGFDPVGQKIKVALARLAGRTVA